MKLRYFLFPLVIIILAFGIFAGYAYITTFRQTVPGDFVLTIEQGDTLISLIKKVQENGLKGDQQLYYYYTRLAFPGFIVKKGMYSVKKGYDFLDIVSIVQQGIGILAKTTVPPGLSLDELEEYFSSKQIMTKNDFIRISGDPKFVEQWKYIYKSSLEGFLFPETYFYSPDIRPEEFISLLVTEFFSQLGRVTDYKSMPPGDLYEKIIIASLIEEEAFLDDEKPIIASVIYNRLKKGMRLELCPTVEYILADHKKNLTLKDLETPSPYNTYLHKGLPPTPICNPSLKSLMAAFFPAQTNYLFYVAKGDGSHYFSETYEQHLYYKSISDF